MNEQPMIDKDRLDVTMLCLAETILTTIANRQKPKSRRYNKLMAALGNITQADATYHGHMPEDYYANAEATLQKIEDDLMALYKKDSEDEPATR